MAETKTVLVDAEELHLAFDFVSSGQPFEHSAYICLDTGRIYWHSDALDVDEDLPEALEESDRYIAVPDKNDLELGRRLVLAFVRQELPHDYRTVDAIFQRRGAYRRFKDFLQERGALERWYEFENEATERALHAWCEANGIHLVKG
jgi:hypothetical protein